MASQDTSSTFVSFPEKDVILEKLRSMEGYGQELEPLSRLVADRLALKAYDSSAFVFILIELIYEFQEIYTGPLSDLLTRSVRVLTKNEELASSALNAYNEITATLDPGENGEPEAGAPEGGVDAGPDDDRTDGETDLSPSLDDTRPGGIDDEFLEEAFPVADEDPIGPYMARAKGPDQERLMVELQEAQKQLADLGFSTRMAIDLTLSRTGSDSVSHTLREIAALRAALRSFDTLLAESQEQILEQIGVLEKD